MSTGQGEGARTLALRRSRIPTARSATSAAGSPTTESRVSHSRRASISASQRSHPWQSSSEGPEQVLPHDQNYACPADLGMTRVYPVWTRGKSAAQPLRARSGFCQGPWPSTRRSKRLLGSARRRSRRREKVPTECEIQNQCRRHLPNSQN